MNFHQPRLFAPRGDKPQRTRHDILFGHEVGSHRTQTIYDWSCKQSNIISIYTVVFSNRYTQKIETLLESLDLHGYEGILTDEGVDFKNRILIPKVLKEVVRVIEFDNMDQSSVHIVRKPYLPLFLPQESHQRESGVLPDSPKRPTEPPNAVYTQFPNFKDTPVPPKQQHEDSPANEVKSLTKRVDDLENYVHGKKHENRFEGSNPIGLAKMLEDLMKEDLKYVNH
ncbi:hypothetical protein F5Y11DRAFT_57238 [Daldinia sp. FL1419]|nr:hypothetical protein F5Y11DRAFT_57238 [Daldinia sp. FL1419]